MENHAHGILIQIHKCIPAYARATMELIANQRDQGQPGFNLDPAMRRECCKQRGGQGVIFS